MGRDIRRVPLDFDAPLNKTWAGFLRPDEIKVPLCPDCSYGPGQGTHGQSPALRAMYDTFWPHNFGYSREDAKALAWRDKLGQGDIDFLVEQEFFRRRVEREPTEDNPRTWSLEYFAPTVEEVNAYSGDDNKRDMFHPLDLGSGAAQMLARYRCERLGLPTECATCEGHGHLATPEQLAVYDAWVPAEVPTGEGWQMWENVSEGSPVTGVFETKEGLARHLYQTGQGLMSHFGSYEQALGFVEAGWAPTGIDVGNGFEAGTTVIGRENAEGNA